MIAGIGLDLVDVARVKKLLASRGDRALTRLFTAREVEYCTRRRQPSVHFAARIAAKEAAYKALSGTPAACGIGWRDMEVLSDGAQPTLVLHGAAARRAREMRVARAWLTMSHSEATAGAVVVLEAGD